MRLLIITQKADRKDSVLGFFHRWIEEFAKDCDSVIVLAQLVGEHALPPNVRVLSLGKEGGHSRFSQITRAWKLLWSFRREYDCVLVHMTPVWITLTAPLLFVLRKPLYLWYEVRRGGMVLKTALLFVKKVFTATPAGLPFPSRKAVVVGHGIDVQTFAPSTGKREPGLIAAVGRVTPVKRFDLIIRTLKQLPSASLDIAGGPVTESDREEVRRLEDLITRSNLTDHVTIKARSHLEVAKLFQRATLSLHACGGGLDKAVLEAMACECPIISISEAARHVLPIDCQADEKTLAAKTAEMLALPEEKRAELGKKLREIVIHNHSLNRLVLRLIQEM